MAVVEPAHLAEFMAIAAKWDVEATVIGEVTDGTHLEVLWGQDLIVEVPPRSVAHDGPVYDRPMQRPAYLDELQADSAARLPRPTDGDGLRAALLAVLGSPNGCDRSWVTRQYDRYVRGNTAQAMPDDAGVVRVDEASGRGVALSTDCNARFVELDPYAGAQLALAEAYRNVAVSGARPLAVSDCLNFGSPEDPGVMWQFAQAVTGLADGCLELGIPVTGGNVSFYNQTGDLPIHPTPVVAVLGVLDDVADRNRSGWSQRGQALYLLGRTREELDGSLWSQVVHDHLGGRPPVVDLAAERLLAGTVLSATSAGLVHSAHDLSEGGLAVALAEGVLRHGVGAEVSMDSLCTREGVDPFTALFSESAARALVAVAADDAAAFEALCAEQGQAAVRLGVTAGGSDAAAGSLLVQGCFELSVEHLLEARTGVIEAALCR